MKRSSHKSGASHATNYVVGRTRFAAISAVEGVALTKAMKADFDRFDKEGWSSEQRRHHILSRFAKTSR